MRHVSVESPSFPQVPSDRPLRVAEAQRWQVLCGDAGHWRVHIDRSSWLALLVRGQYANRPELIAAHSSPVVATVDGAPFFSAADSLSILQQLEGALAYIDTIGTRAEDAAYQRMRLRLTSVYRQLHNELHQRGYFHAHTHSTDHT